MTIKIRKCRIAGHLISSFMSTTELPQFTSDKTRDSTSFNEPALLISLIDESDRGVQLRADVRSSAWTRCQIRTCIHPLNKCCA
jgi:hypothetical protein